MIRGCNALRPGVQVTIWHYALRQRLPAVLVRHQGLGRWKVQLESGEVVSAKAREMRIVKWEDKT